MAASRRQYALYDPADRRSNLIFIHSIVKRLISFQVAFTFSYDLSLA